MCYMEHNWRHYDSILNLNHLEFGKAVNKLHWRVKKLRKKEGKNVKPTENMQVGKSQGQTWNPWNCTHLNSCNRARLSLTGLVGVLCLLIRLIHLLHFKLWRKIFSVESLPSVDSLNLQRSKSHKVKKKKTFYACSLNVIPHLKYIFPPVLPMK